MGASETTAQEIDREYEMELREEENAVEALLFTMGVSVGIDQIAQALDVGRAAAEKAAARLADRYQAEQRGIRIQRFEDRWQLCTDPKYYPNLIRVAQQPKKPVLTEVVMETLAIIAYRQPVTKAEIEKIRGVSSDHAVNRLIEYDLVYESGRLNAPGRPALFSTTEDFLRRFGLSSITELPGLDPEAQDEIENEVKEEVAASLGASREAVQEMMEMAAMAEEITEEIPEETAPEKGTDGRDNQDQVPLG